MVDNCGQVTDIDPGGQYLLSLGENTGIYEVSISDRKCITLVPDIVTQSAVLLAMISHSCMQLLPMVRSRFSVILGETEKSSGCARSG